MPPRDSWETNPATTKAQFQSQAKETDPLLLDKDARSNYISKDAFGLLSWLSNLQQQFGIKLLLLLFVVQHVLKGFVLGFAGQADPYLYKSYKVPAPQMQIFSSVTSLPWAMKPIIGLISDVFPICGYNKAPYFLLTSVLGAAAFAAIGGVPHEAFSVHGLVACMFLTQLQTSTCDLLSEAKYAEKIQDNPSHGPDLLTYVWFGASVGGLFAAMSCGAVIEDFGAKAPYLISTVPAFAVVLPVAFGFLEERRLSHEEVEQVRERFRKQTAMCGLCVLMLIGTLLLTACGLMYEDPLINGVVAIVVAIVIIVAFSIVLSPVIAKFNAFSVMQSAASLSISGASFYFYTDTPEQYPEGPHFSPFFFNTVMGVGGALCTLFGIWCYNQYMQNWHYGYLFVVTNVSFSLLCSLDLVMFTRTNVHLGIPDHVFVLGSSALETVVRQWMWMPQVVILSYLCPKGMEATMYALLAGCANLGSAIASNLGALVLQQLNCRPNGDVGESEQFENLWVASALSTVLPLCTIFMIPWLVPNARQNERLIGAESEADATAGSLWRRWTEITQPPTLQMH